MTTVRRVYLRSGSAPRVPKAYRKGVVVDVFDNKSESTLANNLEDIARRVGRPAPAALDLLLFSAAVYVADKRTDRSDTDDGWSRRFILRAPASDQSMWETYSNTLSAALNFLTGDRWSLSFHHGVNALPRASRIGAERYTGVCLFSGGLDSLAGAIELLATTRGRVLLVGHHDSSLTGPAQQDLATRLADKFGSSRVDLQQVLLRPAPRTPNQEYPLPEEDEKTTRSRSLIFVSLALACASAIGPKVPVWMPENGYIALNAPLTGARVGSSSTRTTHPYFIASLRAVLDGLGLAHELRNPFSLMTKGELLGHSREPDLLRRLAPRSVSCAHPEVGRYNADPSRRAFGNCGYCYPCIVRRAAMHAIGLDRSTDYAYDVLRDLTLVQRGTTGRGRDLRAVLAMLHDRSGLAASRLAVLRAGPLPADTNLAGLVAMHRRGADELRAFFDGASARMRRAAGFSEST